jgi:hypothetical protein
MATSPVQWYKSKIVFGTNTCYPCYPPATMEAPENDAAPPIIGNYGLFHTGDGLIQPYLDVRLAVRDFANEVLSSTFLGHFFSRSGDAAHDTTAILNGVSVWDGYKCMALSGVKADSLTIACSKGDDITFTARFVFTGITESAVDPYGAFSGWSTDRVLRFNAVTFGGGLANRPWSFTLSYSNNHHPDMALDGTRYPAAWNAGMWTAGFQMTVQAQDQVAVPGAGTIPDETAIAFTIAGTPPRAITLTVARPSNQNKKGRAIQPPRIMRAYQFLCLGGAYNTAPVTGWDGGTF